MRRPSPFHAVLLLGALALAPGCNPPGTRSVKVPPAAASVKEVPALRIVLDCGDCQVREEVGRRIQAGYAEAARSVGMAVSTTRTATVTLLEAHERPVLARLIFAAWSGKDALKARIQDGDRTFLVENAYRDQIYGMDSLSRRVGWMIFEEMLPKA